MRRMRLGRKGVSLAEVVVALALVTVVMASVLTIMLNGVKVQDKMVARTEAQNFVSDALECFKVAEDETAFKEALDYAGFSEYSIQYGNVTATVTVEYDSKEGPHFSAVVKEKLSGEILSLEYTKAG